jgi:ribose-phosphate pyrophosphokinase
MITFKAKDPSGEIINSALSPFAFPAGEAHIKREEQRDLEPIEIAILQPSAATIHDDLFKLAMWNSYILRHDYEKFHYSPKRHTKTVLVLPYIPGARADRGNPFGLEVYADFINDMYLSQIIVFDPHSEVSEELLGDEMNLTVVHSDELWRQAYIKPILDEYTAIIAPDKGAVERASAVADILDLPLLTATKERDFETGKLTNFAIDGITEEGRYLIVDDICEGGGTFLGLVESFPVEPDQIDLFVSHGSFSGHALYKLPKTFYKVYTTNSYNPQRDLNAHNIVGTFERFDVIRLLLSKIK